MYGIAELQTCLVHSTMPVGSINLLDSFQFHGHQWIGAVPGVQTISKWIQQIICCMCHKCQKHLSVLLHGAIAARGIVIGSDIDWTQETDAWPLEQVELTNIWLLQ